MVSAFNAQGPPARLVEMALLSTFELVLLEPVLHELIRVLGLKFSWEREDLARLGVRLRGIAGPAHPVPDRVEALTGDPDDDLVLAAAFDANAELLVTGDRRHLLPLGQVGDLRILTPQALLSELLTQSS